MYAKLTHQETGEIIYVNASLVVCFDKDASGATRIVFDSDFAYLVKEDLDATKVLLNHAAKHCC